MLIMMYSIIQICTRMVLDIGEANNAIVYSDSVRVM